MSQNFKALLKEAAELGVHYVGDDATELGMFIVMARAKRGGEGVPGCYGFSFDGTDRRCRMCSLRGACADLDRKPRVEVLGPVTLLDPISCGACERGNLSQELAHPETREIVDYACSNPACQNTLAIQMGWGGPQAAVEVVLGEPTPEKPAAPPREVLSSEPEPEPAVVPPKKIKIKVRVPAPVAAPPKTKRKAKVAAVVARVRAEVATVDDPPVPAAEVKRKGRPPGKNSSAPGVVFRCDGREFSTLGQVAAQCVAENKRADFFKVGPGAFTPGNVIQREYQGRMIRVEVCRAK